MPYTPDMWVSEKSEWWDAGSGRMWHLWWHSGMRMECAHFRDASRNPIENLHSILCFSGQSMPGLNPSYIALFRDRAVCWIKQEGRRAPRVNWVREGTVFTVSTRNFQLCLQKNDAKKKTLKIFSHLFYEFPWFVLKEKKMCFYCLLNWLCHPKIWFFSLLKIIENCRAICWS